MQCRYLIYSCVHYHAAANLLEEVQGSLKQRDRSETVHFLVSNT